MGPTASVSAGVLSVMTAAIVGGLPSSVGEDEGEQMWGIAHQQAMAAETSEEAVAAVRPRHVTGKAPLSAKAQQK